MHIFTSFSVTAYKENAPDDFENRQAYFLHSFSIYFFAEYLNKLFTCVPSVQKLVLSQRLIAELFGVPRPAFKFCIAHVVLLNAGIAATGYAGTCFFTMFTPGSALTIAQAKALSLK